MNSKISNFGNTTITTTKSVLFFGKDVIFISLTLLPLIIGFVIFLATSTFILKNGHVILSEAEYYMRCEINVAGKNLIPFFNMTRYILTSGICWTNSIGLLRSLFSDNFLYGQTSLCLTEGESVLDILKKGSDILTSLYISISRWIASNPFINTFPLYGILEPLVIVADTIRSLLSCLCGLLDPLWKFITNRIRDTSLFCLSNQLINGLLSILQITLSTAVNTIIDLLTSLFSGTILETLTNIWNLQTTFYPLLTTSMDKISVSFNYLGNYITNIFVDLVCIIVSEAEQSINGFEAVEIRYASCLASSDQINIGCIIGRILNVFLKIVQVILQLLSGIFKFLQPNDDFKWNIWNPNIIWDSIRDPLILESYQYIQDSWIERDSQSTISNFNYSNNISSCKEITPLIDDIPICSECTQISNTSLETCLCDAMTKIDDLIFPATNRRIFNPIICKGIMGVLRVAVSLVKFVVDLLRTFEITPKPKIIDFLANVNSYDRVLNEIAGDVNNIGGLVYFLNNLIIELVPNHPELECIPSLITFPLKAIAETIRFIAHLFQNFFADLRIILFSEVNPFVNSSFLGTYVCVYPYGGQRCFNTNDIFKWLKLPRNTSNFFKNEVDFATINTSLGNYRQGLLECTCYVINLRFISSFSEDLPFLNGFDLPDICCPFYNFGRVIVETVQFIFNIIISFFQTIFEVSKPIQLSEIFILRYLACITNNTMDPCSNINAILNDVTDTFKCLCSFITELIEIPEISAVISTDPLICLCDFLTGIVVTISNSLITIRDSAETIIGILDCINVTDGSFKQNDTCQILLPLNAINIFNTLNLVVDAIGTVLTKFACLISNIFAYKCLNIPSQPLCLSVDFSGCITKRGCESYAPLSLIGNNFPSEEEIINCEIQCGEDDCEYCLTVINISLNMYDGSVIGCPNGCVNPESCTPSDKFAPIFNSIYLLLGNIIKLLLSWIEQILVFIIQTSTGNNLTPNVDVPSTLAEFLDQFLTVIGTTLFGDTIHTWGPLQYLGDFLNCIIGPPGCDGGLSMPPVDITSFFPTQEPSTKCFGSIFILIGNILGQLYDDIKTILVSFVGFVEAILTGQNTSLIGTYIKNFILGIFSLIGHLIKNLELIAQFLLGFIAGIFDLIFPNSYDTIFTVLNTVFKPFLFVLQSIFNFLKLIGVFSKKRFLGFDEQIYDAYANGIFEKWQEFHNQFNYLNITNSFNLKNIIDQYKIYYNKSSPSDFSKRFAENTENNLDGANNFTLIFQNEHNLTDDEMIIISNPSLLLPLVSNDTYCYKVIKHLKDISYQSMNLFEELAFKTCYASVLVPLINNNNQNAGLILPPDIFYNLDTLINSILDIGSMINLKNTWNSPILHNHFLLYVSETNTLNSTITNQIKKRQYLERQNIEDESYHVDNTTLYDGFYSYIAEKTENSKQKELLLSYLGVTNNTKYVSSSVRQLLNFFDKITTFDLKNVSYDYKYSWLPSDTSINSIISDIINKTQKLDSPYQQQANFGFKSNNFLKLLPLFHKYKKNNYEKSFIKFHAKASSYDSSKPNNLKQLHSKLKQMHSNKLYNPSNDLSQQSPLLSFLNEYTFKTIPVTFNYWHKRWNQKDKLQDMTNLKRTYLSKNKTITNEKENGLSFIFRNVLLDRAFLVSDVISQIIKKEINNITIGILNMSLNYSNNMDVDSKSLIKLADPKTFNKRRPLLMERIFLLHKKLKMIKKINIPDIPKSLHTLVNNQESLKRRLVDIDCNCNCTILDSFVQELVNISTYCYEKQFLGIADPLNLTLTTTSLFKVTYYDSNKVYPFPENIIYPIIRIDLLTTLIDFIANFNTDITTGPVGLLYIIRRLPIPFASIPCSRINLTCQLGIGLVNGMIVSGIIVFIFGVLLFIFSPSIAGLLNMVFIATIFGSLSLMFLGLTLNLAWGYQLNCFNPDENSIFSLAFPSLNFIKMLPECSADEIYNFITNYIIVPCPLDSYSTFGLQNLIPNISSSDLCPVCPQKLNFTSCYDYGIESPFTVFGMFLLRYIPPLGQFLQNSCLVRGNCFGFLLGSSSHSLKNDGLLGSLFTNFNSTEFIQQANPLLEQCFYFNSLSIVTGLILSLFLTILAIYSIILAFDIINWIISILLLFQSDDLNKGDIELSKKYYG
jgi:hypothetical protein